MKYELSEIDKRLIDRVSKITGVNYEIDNDNYIEADKLLTIIDDLETRYSALETKHFEFEQKVQEQYEQKKIDPYLEYGVRETDFH